MHGHELDQTSGDGEGQGDLAFCSPKGRKVLDTTGWLNSINSCMPVSCQMQSIPSPSWILAGLGFLWLLKYSRNDVMPGWGQIVRKTDVFCFLPLRTSPHALRCPSNYTDKSMWTRIKDVRQQSWLTCQLIAMNNLLILWVSQLINESISLVWATDTTQNRSELTTHDPGQLQIHG